MRHSLGGIIGHLTRIGVRAVGLPVRFAARLFRGGLYTAKVTGQFVGEVAIVGLTGAAIGAALGLTLATMNNQNYVDLVPLNAAVGGGIASVVGVVLALLPTRSAARRSVAA
jgi:ABC-type antimicrobial peptide transport system permease subunit